MPPARCVRRRPSRIFWLTALLLAAGLVRAEALVIAVHPESALASASSDEVAALYLKQRSSIGGISRLEPLDLRDKSSRDAFYLQVVDRTAPQVRAYWSKMVFTGKARPPKSLGVDDMVARLREDREAVGYLPASRATDLKVLLTLP